MRRARPALILRFAALWYVLALVAGTLLGSTVRAASGAQSGTAPRASAAAPEAPRVTEVGPIEMTVSNLDRSVEFYTRVLGFRRVSETEAWGDALERVQGVFGARVRQARLALGDESIELTEYLAPRGRPRPAETRNNDRSFQHIAIIVSDMAKAYQTLRRHGVEHASTGPQRLPDWNPNAGGIEAFYFRDPDGHALEVLRFPKGKGAARWQRKDRLFLGIDHTAIVVGDTDASLAFYRDVLGLTVAGTSENWGEEQERLNNVFGARLRITSLTAGRGPAIEFLEYLAPRDGRPFPADARANDLVHWQTTLRTPRLDALETALRQARTVYVSPGVVTLPDTKLGFSRGLLVRDPDGHVMEVVQR